MKRILSIFSLLLFCLAASAASQRVTITLTVTNVPAAGNTVTLNGGARTWRSSVTTPSTEIGIGADIGASATNLFRQLSSYQLTGPVVLGFLSTNVITIKGAINQAMSASASGTWATIALSTNAVTTMNDIRVPMSGEPTQSTATNNASQLISDIGIYSTNAYQPRSGIALVYIAGKTNQLVVGNGVIRPDGSGNATLVSSATGDPYEANSESDILNLYSAKLNFPQSYAVVTNTWLSTNIFGYIETTGAKNTAQTAIGGGATNFALTNIFLYQTNYSTGIWGHTRANNTTLANGNNAGIDFGTKTFVKIKAGPTLAFAICGIAGGADGRELILYNATGQAMTISNDSGVDPTVANRIYTNTGGDVVTTGNGAVRLIYDSEDSHWVVLSLQQ